MVNKNKQERVKTAKDLAFDKERAKFRSEIRSREQQIVKLMAEKEDIKRDLEEKEKTILELQDWIRRLLEYTELSEEDMKKLIQKEKDSAEVLNRMNSLFGVFDIIGGSMFRI